VIVFESMLYFLGFFAVWLEMTCEFIRFKNMPGLFDDALRFAYLLGIITMAVQIKPSSYMMDQAFGYMMGFIVCLGTQLIVHTIYYARLERAARYAIWRVRNYFLCCTLLLIAALVDDYWFSVLAILISATMTIFISVNSFRMAFLPKMSKDDTIIFDHHKKMVVATPGTGRAPRDDEEFIERFGLIVMITTGESILALIVGGSDLFQQEWRYYMLVQVAFITMFYMKNLYFASNCEMHEGHALVEHDIPGGCVWVVCHGVLAYFLLSCGVGFKLIFASMPGVAYPWYRDILAISMAGAVIMLLLIRTAHDKYIFSIVSCLRIPPTVLMAISGRYIEDSVALVVWCCVMVFCLYLIDELLLDKYEVKEVYKNQSHGHGHGGHGHGGGDHGGHGGHGGGHGGHAETEMAETKAGHDSHHTPDE